MMAEDQGVHLEFVYTPQEWREARLAAASKTGRPLHFYRGILGWFVCIGLAVVLVSLVNVRKAPHPARPPAAPEPDSTLSSILLQLIPWACIFGVIMFLVLRQQFGWFGAWKGNPLFQQVQSFDMDGQGVRLSTGVSNTHWKWEAFVGWSETPRLLLLRLESKAVLAIPKRAGDVGQLERIRQLARENAVTRPGGFPVLPLSPPVGSDPSVGHPSEL